MKHKFDVDLVEALELPVIPLQGIVVPDTESERAHNDPSVFRFEFTYLHGTLEEAAGYDCYSLRLPIEHPFRVTSKTYRVIRSSEQHGDKTGIYSISYKDKPGYLFLWVRPGEGWGGLAVYTDDYASIAYALKKFTLKAVAISRSASESVRV